MALDKDALSSDISDHVADVASGTDPVNSAVSTMSFICSLFRKYKTDPVAISALADAFDDRRTEMAQAVVANTSVEPSDADRSQKGTADQTEEPGPVDANSGSFGTRQQPTLNEPSYIPPSAGDAGGAVKDGVTLADKQAADASAKDKPIGKTVAA